MVFVGYGLSIPEADRDDFAGQNLKGKIAVVNQFPPVKVADNVRSHVNTADERWLALKRAGAIGVATPALPRLQATPSPAAATPPAPTPAAPPRRPVLDAAAWRLSPRRSSHFDRELVDAAGQAVAINITARAPRRSWQERHRRRACEARGRWQTAAEVSPSQAH